jgi:hypothetical protein
MYDMGFPNFSTMCCQAQERCPHSIGQLNSQCKYDSKQQKCYSTRVDRRRWGRIRKEVFSRDSYKCRLLSILSEDEKSGLPLDGLNKKLDPAHVFGRGSHPHMKYEVDNVVTLSRLFHNRLDQYKNPLTGEDISLDETYEWWKRIAGNVWESLYLKAKGLDK